MEITLDVKESAVHNIILSILTVWFSSELCSMGVQKENVIKKFISSQKLFNLISISLTLYTPTLFFKSY